MTESKKAYKEMLFVNQKNVIAIVLQKYGFMRNGSLISGSIYR